MNFTLTGKALCAALMIAFAAPVCAASVKPNFTGTWKFNLEQSDEPRSLVLRPIEGASGALPSLPSPNLGRAQISVAPTHLPPLEEILTIVHNDPELTVTPQIPPDATFVMKGGSVPPQTHYTDGRTTEHSFNGGGILTSNARWVGNELIVEINLPLGGKITETYSLSANNQQLTIITRLENERLHRDPITTRRVYDKQPCE